MQKLKIFLLDRRNLVLFYILGCLIIELILSNIIGNTSFYRFLYSRGFPFLYYLWTIFFLGRDIYEHKVPKDLCLIFIWLVIAFGFISWVFCPSGHSVGNFGMLIHQITMSYIILTLGNHYSFEENNEYLTKVSKIYVIFITVVNILNLIMYTTGRLDLLMPGRNSDVVGSAHAGGNVRYIGLYEYLTSAGYLSAVSLILSLYLGSRKSMNTIVSAFCVFVSLSMIYINDTRNAIIQCGLVFLAGIYYVLRKNLSRRKSGLTLCTLLFLLFLVLSVAYKDKIILAFRLIKDDSYVLLNHYSSGRLEIYRHTINLVRKRFIYGYGWFNNLFIQQASGHPHCHNVFLSMAYWSGIPCLLAFVGFTIEVFRQLFCKRDLIGKYYGFWPCVLVICIFFESLLDNAVMGDLLRLETAFFWICLGYLLYGIKDNYGSEE